MTCERLRSEFPSHAVSTMIEYEWNQIPDESRKSLFEFICCHAQRESATRHQWVMNSSRCGLDVRPPRQLKAFNRRRRHRPQIASIVARCVFRKARIPIQQLLNLFQVERLWLRECRNVDSLFGSGINSGTARLFDCNFLLCHLFFVIETFLWIGTTMSSQ